MPYKIVVDDSKKSLTTSKYLMIRGALQNIDGVIHVKATHLTNLAGNTLDIRSHDFH
jgi:error-prone DNA polymerase